MKAIMAICKRELKSYFLSPLAYVLGAVYLMLSGLFFYLSTIGSNFASMDYVFGNMIFIFLIISPILTMRLIAEEKKLGTDQLLYTSPIRLYQVVLGKYFAVVIVYLLILLITLIYPFILYYYSRIDLGPVLAGYIGLILIGGAFLSAGLFASSITENQIVAAVIGFCILLMSWAIGWLGGMFGETMRKIFDYLSILNHFEQFQLGILETSSIAYYISYTFLFIFFTIAVLENKRWTRG